jgi:hypothetical protein
MAANRVAGVAQMGKCCSVGAFEALLELNGVWFDAQQHQLIGTLVDFVLDTHPIYAGSFVQCYACCVRWSRVPGVEEWEGGRWRGVYYHSTACISASESLIASTAADCCAIWCDAVAGEVRGGKRFGFGARSFLGDTVSVQADVQQLLKSA